MSVYDQADYDPKRRPSKNIRAAVSEVTYSSRTNVARNNHWSKSDKNKERVCTSASQRDEEFELRAQEHGEVGQASE